MRSFRSMLLLTALFGCPIVAHTQTNYSLKLLGDPSGSNVSESDYISNNGSVAGAGMNQAFGWSKSTGIEQIPLIGGVLGDTYARGINSSGQVAGFQVAGNGGRFTAYVWSHETGTVLPTGLDQQNSMCYAINDSAQLLVGLGNFVLGTYDTYVWSPGGSTKKLDRWDTNFATSGTVMNNSGLAAGYAGLPNRNRMSVYWTPDGKIHDFGHPDFQTQADPRAISIDGSFACSTWSPSHGNYGAVRHPDGSWSVVENLWHPGKQTFLTGINSNDDAVGYGFYDTGQDSAFLYTAAGQFVRLQDVVDSSADGYAVTYANSINDSGQIAVTVFKDGLAHAGVLTPVVPEPTTIAMFLGTLCFVGLRLRRRR